MMRRACALGLFAPVLAGCFQWGEGGLPDAPSGLEVTGFTTTSVSISWKDKSDNEDGFRIYRDDGSGSAELHATGFTSYVDASVEEDTVYRYYVVAYNGDGESARSNVVRVIPAPYYVALLTPDGGEDWVIGEMHDITWETNMPQFDANIFLSTDGGSSWPHEIQSAWYPNGSPYQWKVGYKNVRGPRDAPEWQEVVSAEMTLCVISIEQYGSPTFRDESDDVFTIRP